MSAAEKANARAEDSKVVSTEPLDSKDARWTKLVRINYQNPLGKPAIWESAERTTRTANPAGIDGVGVLALLPTPAGMALILQKQFRPPVGKVCIEIPAGLLDAGEDASACAVRELKEETGFVGTLEAGHGGTEAAGGEAGTGQGVMFNDPGFTNTNLQLVRVRIDPADPANAEGQRRPALEADEFITTFTVLVKDLWAECRRLEGEGYAIDARVGTLAEGVKLAGELGLG